MVATSRRLGGETIRTATTWWSPTAAMRPDRAARYQVFSATTTFRLDPDVERHVGSANGSSVGGVALRWLYAFEDSVFPFRGRSTNVFDYAVFAADVQATLVECGLALAERLHCCSGAPALLLAGGGALNAHMNRDLAASGLWQAVAGTAAPHDAGAAVGAGFLAARLVGDQVKPRAPGTPPPIFLGPPVSGGDIEAALDRAGVDAGGRDDVFDVAATTLGRGGLVAWFEGSDEFGPRALGARSLLAPANTRDSLHRLNAVKGRAPWRPAALSLLPHAFAQLEIETPRDGLTEYMLCAHQVAPSSQREVSAGVHVDGTTRAQSVAKGSLAQLLGGRSRRIPA
jgi:carbamoyltransferase